MRVFATFVITGLTLSTMGCGLESEQRESYWDDRDDQRMYAYTDVGVGSTGEPPPGTDTYVDTGADTGSELVCEVLETCEVDGEGEACVPRSLYGKVAASEYYNTCRNYCFADDHCFDRATAMLGELDGACTPDLRGDDGTWCGELSPPDSVGTCDDLVYKVIIRYPAGDDWSYHIASLVKTCEDGLCTIDPIGQPGSSPTTTCRSAADWCSTWAHGHTVEWSDTASQPPAGKVYCEIAPGNQEYWNDSSVADPTNGGTVTAVCKSLSDHVTGLCARGKTPFPAGCGVDSDGDGIPDKWDKCPNSPADADVDYCSADRLGCADDELPGGTTGGTTGGEEGGTTWGGEGGTTWGGEDGGTTWGSDDGDLTGDGWSYDLGVPIHTQQPAL
jgi:hypothetical protein